MRKVVVCSCIGSILFAMCDRQEDAIEFSLLNENSFILEVDRVSNMPDVQFPDDNLQASDYVISYEQIQYNLTFSKNGQTVTIGSNSNCESFYKYAKDARVTE